MKMPCSPKTMLKIGAIIAIPLILGFIFVPQLRIAIVGLAPFALFAICPLSMIFCMKGIMGGKKEGDTCSSCGHDHAKAEHVESEKG